MSEVFDPDKIERPYVKEWGHHAVYPADYDKLLALYRELVPLPPDPSTLPTIAEMRGLLNR